MKGKEKNIQKYQNWSVACPDIQIDGPNADSDYNVNCKPKPVISKVPWHVDEWTLD